MLAVVVEPDELLRAVLAPPVDADRETLLPVVVPLRASVELLPMPCVGAAVVPDEVFIPRLPALVVPADCVRALLFAVVPSVDRPVAEAGFALASVARFAASKFAGRGPEERAELTAPRLVADAGGTCVVEEWPPSTDARVGLTSAVRIMLPLPRSAFGTAPPTRLIAAPEAIADFEAAVTAPAVLRKP